MKRRAIPLTASGWTVAVLAVVAYVAGWLLGWVELMVVAAGCLIVLAVALPFVIGRLALDVERTLEPERVTVGDQAVAVMRVTNPRRTPIASRTIEEHVGGRPLRLDVPPLGPGRATEADLPAADRPARRRPRRAGADREDRPARPDAPGDRPDRRADAVGAPARRRPRPAAGRVRQGPRGADVGRLAGRRRRLPRPARVRARRRPPPHPLDVVGPHGHADGAPLRRQPATQPHRRRRHRDRLVPLRAAVRPGDRGRRVARRVVDDARPAGRRVARPQRRHRPAPPRRAHRPPRPPDAGRRARPAPTSPTPPCTRCAPRPARRPSSSSPATCRPTGSSPWRPSPAARPG